MKTDTADPIAVALAEDIGKGDLTSEFFVPENTQASARLIARERAILAGIKTAATVFRRIDRSLKIEANCNDGQEVNSGHVVLELRGSARSILKGERVALNFLQHLSGIATLTRKFVDAAANEHVRILDTRKTTPGLRALEKAAVVAGGGGNHRFGLFDMVLVKDNHLAANAQFGALGEAIRNLRRKHPAVRVEVEADRLEQVHAFLEIDGIDVILLDNMTPAQIREAVALGKNKVQFEASGGIRLKNVRQIAATGVDYISIGALTHSPRAIDFSLEVTPLSE
jgi:nicotinate-nucleotide pyrophosphorylase (carboxylating)